jgi:hypothetical protein
VVAGAAGERSCSELLLATSGGLLRRRVGLLRRRLRRLRRLRRPTWPALLLLLRAALGVAEASTLSLSVACDSVVPARARESV